MSLSGRLIKGGLKLHNRIHNSKCPPQQLQLKSLTSLLKKAEYTTFGQHYGFSTILESNDLIQAFQQQVPLHEYNDIFEQWWHKMLEGEANICWPGKVDHFALSSGTSGSPSKHIPISKDMLQAIQKTSALMLSNTSKNFKFPAAFYSKHFFVLGSSMSLNKKGDVWIGDISGINAKHLSPFYERFYKPGKRIASIQDWDDRIAEVAKEAPNWDIAALAGIPSWVQLMLERIIEHHNLKSIKDIWPNLQVFVSGGIALGPYRKRLEQLVSKDLVYIDTYYTSEGCLAYQARMDNKGLPLKLLLDNGIFFEFIPFDDDNFDQGQVRPNAQAITIDQVKEGIDYALVISTCAGAWRYLLGDTVRFVDTTKAEIIITGRTKHFLSVCGEHLSVDNMNQAVLAIEEELDVSIPEFTVQAVKVDNHFEHHWHLGTKDTNLDTARLTALLDQHLCRLNDDYQTERRDNLLKAIKVTVLPLHTFYDWHASQGKLGGQSKFPKVLTKEQYQDWLEFIA
ncbi:MAG: GH3 auxin-responsive promoter family protein [Aureispira sp.]|nr:GH3 auxin-responsive promoter family protein [Aureispira sp.]